MEVLLLHRHLHRDDVLAALRAATSVGATSPDVVAVEARRIAERRAGTAAEHHVDVGVADAVEGRRVVSLTERRLADPNATIATLPPDTRPLPVISAYDELLARRREHQPSVVADGSPNSATTGEVS